MKKIFRKCFPLLGLVLFAWILSTTNLKEIFQNIRGINYFYVVMAMLIALPVLFNKAVCWNYIKRQQGIKYSIKNSILMYCSSVYIGLITPGRIGEVAKALYLKNDGCSMGKSLVSAVLDRLSDIIFLLVFLFFGSLFVLTIFRQQILILFLGIVIFFLLLIVLLKVGVIKFVLNKFFHIFVPIQYQKSWKVNFQDFINDLKIYKLKHYLVIFLITAFSWIFYYLQMYILAKGVNLNVPFLYLAVSVTVAGFITLIPVSISGIGTRDAALILLFSPLLITKEKIIVFSGLILLAALFAALIGLICWLIKPIRI